MLKWELEDENRMLKARLEELEGKVTKGIKEVLDNTCSESIEHIKDFCTTTGFKFPTKEVTIIIPYGVEISDIEDDVDGWGVDFTIKD